jgi:signal transduction histidine kinase
MTTAGAISLAGSASDGARRVTWRTDDGASGERARFGLKDVRQLLDGVRRTGVSVTLSETGKPHRLDSSSDLAAYRMVQEALTNVTRHAGPGAVARVELAWSEQALTVRVADDGMGVPAHGSAALSTGSGLLGLRERMAVVGGTLAAGPQPDGGFHVVATLPIDRRGD